MQSRDLDNNGSLSFEEFLNAMPGNMVDIPAEDHRYFFIVINTYLNLYILVRHDKSCLSFLYKGNFLLTIRDNVRRHF